MSPLFRWLFAGIFAGMILISATYRRRARQQTGTIPRRQEGGLALFLRLLLALPLFGSVLLTIINPAWMAWSRLGLPEGVRWLGAAMGLVALPLLWWVFRTIGANISETFLTKTDHQLVTTGPYRWVRHPLYTVSTLALLGLGLLADSWFILLFALLALAGVALWVTPREEAALRQKFGPAYEAYCRQTGRFWPRFF